MEIVNTNQKGSLCTKTVALRHISFASHGLKPHWGNVVFYQYPDKKLVIVVDLCDLDSILAKNLNTNQCLTTFRKSKDKHRLV